MAHDFRSPPKPEKPAAEAAPPKKDEQQPEVVHWYARLMRALLIGLAVLNGYLFWAQWAHVNSLAASLGKAEVKCGSRSVSNALSRSIDVGPAYLALDGSEAGYLGWKGGLTAEWEPGKGLYALRTTKELLCTVVVREYMFELETGVPDAQKTWTPGELQTCIRMLHGTGTGGVA